MWYFKTKLIVPHYVLTTSDHRFVTDSVMWNSVKEEHEKGPTWSITSGKLQKVW